MSTSVPALIDSTGITPEIRRMVMADGGVDPTLGGTGLTTFTSGSVLYASALNVWSALAIGTAGKVLTVVGGFPSWAAVGPTILAPSPQNGYILMADNTQAAGQKWIYPPLFDVERQTQRSEITQRGWSVDGPLTRFV